MSYNHCSAGLLCACSHQATLTAILATPCPQVHAGFLSAWLHHGFSEKVLARLRELDSGAQPLRFWVCGAQAGCLCWMNIRTPRPCAQLCCLMLLLCVAHPACFSARRI